MADEVMGFDSRHPKHKELQKLIREKNKPRQEKYTDLVDRIAANKIRKAMLEE